MFLQEYTRARAAAGGMAEIGVVTVWERPTRVIVTAMFVLGAGIYVSAAADVGDVRRLRRGCGLGVVGLDATERRGAAPPADRRVTSRPPARPASPGGAADDADTLSIAVFAAPKLNPEPIRRRRK